MAAASKKAAAIALIAAHSAKRNLELGSFSFIGERDGKVVAELSNGKLFELFTIESIRGKDGRDGMSIAGRDGKHGRGIETITQPNDSQLDIELTDGQRLRFALPKGEKGDPGRDGKDGIAGPRGERGPIGAAGRDGIGIQGEKGQKGDTGPAPDHEWRGTELRFRNPDGSWGKWVDLRGQPGRDGRKGFVLNGSTTGSGTGGDGIQSIVAGTGIAVDNTDPQNPIVSATGASGEGRQEIFIGEQPAIDYAAISYSLIPGTNLYRMTVNVV